MAKDRGRRPSSDLFGSILRTAVQQLGTVREVVAQKTREGRQQLDLALLRRKRRDALAGLGEVTARLAREGRLTEDDFPELGAKLSAVEAIEERIAQAGGEDAAPDDWRSAGDGDGGGEADLDDDVDDREEYDDDPDDDDGGDGEDDGGGAGTGGRRKA